MRHLDEGGDAARFTSVGAPLPHVEMRVADPETGCTVARGERGELRVRGYLVTQGYWRDAVATAAAFDADGWLRTGDLGTIDESGVVRVVGRAKDIVIRGGENIDPAEVEAVLSEHPLVAEAAVVAAPDAFMGEELAAFVRCHGPFDVEELRSWCRARLAHFKVPRYVWPVEELPVTGSGKVKKHLLRDRAAELVGATTPS